jgi:hypothetical protein
MFPRAGKKLAREQSGMWLRLSVYLEREVLPGWQKSEWRRNEPGKAVLLTGSSIQVKNSTVYFTALHGVVIEGWSENPD